MPILLRILRFIIITIIDRLIVQKLSAPKTEVKPKLEDNSVLLSSLKQEYALSQKTFIAKHFGFCNSQTEGYVSALVATSQGQVLLDLIKPESAAHLKVKKYLADSQINIKYNPKV